MVAAVVSLWAIVAGVASAADSGSQIDLLVAYTPVARAEVGGTAAMQGQINTLVGEVNTALSNSGVQFQYRLVNTVEVTYAGATDHESILHHLQSADGSMDEVLTLRNTYKADLVHLIVGDGELTDTCGSGYILRAGDATPGDWAFSLTRRSCDTYVGARFQMGHALGHNFGLQHGADDLHGDGRGDVPPGITTYAYGYVDPGYRFRDIMASDCPLPGPNATPDYNCPRLQYYSNLTANISGAPIGNAGANAAKVLNDYRVQVANYRDSGGAATPTPTATPTGTPTVPPGLNVSISGTSSVEGNVGDRIFAFRATLSASSPQAVTVNYQTQDGTALAASDYVARSGSVTFAPGQTERNILVLVKGDTTVEPNETFTVRLTGATNAALGSATAVGTIENDDPVAAATFVDQWRLYNRGSGEHLYTTDQHEYSVLGPQGWDQEGIAYKLFTSSGSYGGGLTVPFYRLYFFPSAQHHWTTDPNEVMVLSNSTDWSYEGVVGYLLPSPASGTIPMYRLVLTSPLLHLWSTDENEKNVLVSHGWGNEGIVGYVVR